MSKVIQWVLVALALATPALLLACADENTCQNNLDCGPPDGGEDGADGGGEQ